MRKLTSSIFWPLAVIALILWWLPRHSLAAPPSCEALVESLNQTCLEYECILIPSELIGSSAPPTPLCVAPSSDRFFGAADECPSFSFGSECEALYRCTESATLECQPYNFTSSKAVEYRLVCGVGQLGATCSDTTDEEAEIRAFFEETFVFDAGLMSSVQRNVSFCNQDLAGVASLDCLAGLPTSIAMNSSVSSWVRFLPEFRGLVFFSDLASVNIANTVSMVDDEVPLYSTSGTGALHFEEQLLSVLLFGTPPPTVLNSGKISESVLETVILTNLGMSGTIPTEIGLLTHLTQLSLGFNELTGTIPTELGLLVNLQVLDLSYNLLSGTIPTELTQLTRLRVLDLSYNSLVGPVPPSFIAKMPLVQYLSLENNRALVASNISLVFAGDGGQDSANNGSVIVRMDGVATPCPLNYTELALSLSNVKLSGLPDVAYACDTTVEGSCPDPDFVATIGGLMNYDSGVCTLNCNECTKNGGVCVFDPDYETPYGAAFTNPSPSVFSYRCDCVSGGYGLVCQTTQVNSVVFVVILAVLVLVIVCYSLFLYVSIHNKEHDDDEDLYSGPDSGYGWAGRPTARRSGSVRSRKGRNSHSG